MIKVKVKRMYSFSYKGVISPFVFTNPCEYFTRTCLKLKILFLEEMRNNSNLNMIDTIPKIQIFELIKRKDVLRFQQSDSLVPYIEECSSNVLEKYRIHFEARPIGTNIPK